MTLVRKTLNSHLCIKYSSKIATHKNGPLFLAWYNKPGALAMLSCLNYVRCSQKQIIFNYLLEGNSCIRNFTFKIYCSGVLAIFLNYVWNTFFISVLVFFVCVCVRECVQGVLYGMMKWHRKWAIFHFLIQWNGGRHFIHFRCVYGKCIEYVYGANGAHTHNPKMNFN